MNVDFGMNVVRLAPGEAVEVVLPDGNSVWVYANGTVHREKGKKDVT